MTVWIGANGKMCGMNDKPGKDRETALPPVHTSVTRTILRIVALLLIAVALHFAVNWTLARATEMGERGHMVMFGALAAILLIYALLIAIPFVPGVEIGVSLIIIQGSGVVPLVYLATVLGLLIAFVAGKYLPYSWLHRVFLDLRLTRACDLLMRLRPMSRTERLVHLRRSLPRWVAPVMIEYRYVALALLVNLPGNSLIGGGGGISLIAGLTRVYSLGGMIVTVMIAVAPIPLAVVVFGVDFYR